MDNKQKTLLAQHADHGDECSYIVVDDASQIKGQETMSWEVYFTQHPERKAPPDKVELQALIEDTCEVIRETIRPSNPEQAERSFKKLVALAQMGLRCKIANPAAARSDLIRLREALIRDYGRRQRARHLNYLAKLNGLLGCLILFVGFCLEPILRRAGVSVPAFPVQIGNYCAMAAAALGSMWLAYAMRTPRMTFDELRDPTNDHLEPLHRVMYVAGLTIILAFFGELKFLGVFMGKFSTERIGVEWQSALVFGIVCGLSERLLGDAVTPYAESIIKTISKTKPLNSSPEGSAGG